MKNTKILLGLLFTVITLSFNLVLAQQTNVEVNVYTNGTVYFNTNLNTSNSSYVYINGQVANPVYQQITRRSANKESIFKTIGETMLIWTGDKDKEPTKLEHYFMNILSKFATTIANEIYQREILFLELQLEAQKKINNEYQRRFDKLYVMLGANNNSVLKERSVECQAYIDLMAEGKVDEVTCEDRGDIQQWVYDRNLSKAIHFNIPKVLNTTNNSVLSWSSIGDVIDQSELLLKYEQYCNESIETNYIKGIQKYCKDECDYGTSNDCVCRGNKTKVYGLKENGYYEFFCVRMYKQ